MLTHLRPIILTLLGLFPQGIGLGQTAEIPVGIAVYQIIPIDNGTSIDNDFDQLEDINMYVENRTHTATCTDVTSTFSAGMTCFPGSTQCNLAECNIEINTAVPNTIRLYVYKDDAGDWIDNNMVSATDLLLIQKHLLGSDPFYAIVQYIAADENGSGTITSTDLVNIQKILLGTGSPTLEAWNFIDPSFFFNTDFFDAFEEYGPSATRYQNLRSLFTNAFNSSSGAQAYGQFQLTSSSVSRCTLGTLGIKMGDVNFSSDSDYKCGSGIPNIPNMPRLASSNPYSFAENVPTDEVSYKSNPIDFNPEVSGQLIFNKELGEFYIHVDDLRNYDALQLDVQLDGVLKLTFFGSDLPGFDVDNFHYDHTNSTLRIVWFDEMLDAKYRSKSERELACFKVDLIRSQNWGMNASINTLSPLLSKTHDYSGEEHRMNLSFITTPKPAMNNTGGIRVFPNPYKGYTLNVVLESSILDGVDDIELTVNTITGAVLSSQTFDASQGPMFRLHLENSELPSIFLYVLVRKRGQIIASEKIVVIQ